MQLTPQSCELFDIPFFQFAQMKKYCPEMIPTVKTNYKKAWQHWKQLHLALSHQLGHPFAPPHIEKWCNGWQVRAHFFAYYKYDIYQNSAAILSVILNRRRLCVSLDWHSYRAARSTIALSQYNQWLNHLEMERYADFAIWHGTESEYSDFPLLKNLSEQDLQFNDPEQFFCIGKSIEKAELTHYDTLQFISQTIQELCPLYEKCHQ